MTQNDSFYPPEDDEIDEGPSKSQRKRDAHEMQALGVRLVDLPSSQLAGFDLPERLMDAIVLAQKTKAREGRRRQLQLIGKLMRDLDPEPIRKRFEFLEGKDKLAVARMHAAEQWRNRLIEDDNTLNELIQRHPGIDVQALRASIRGARKEAQPGGNPKHYREIYKMVHNAMQASSESTE